MTLPQDSFRKHFPFQPLNWEDKVSKLCYFLDRAPNSAQRTQKSQMRLATVSANSQLSVSTPCVFYSWQNEALRSPHVRIFLFPTARHCSPPLHSIKETVFHSLLGTSSLPSLFPVAVREDFLCPLSFLSLQTTGLILTSWLDKLSTCYHLVIMSSSPVQTIRARIVSLPKLPLISICISKIDVRHFSVPCAAEISQWKDAGTSSKRSERQICSWFDLECWGIALGFPVGWRWLLKQGSS